MSVLKSVAVEEVKRRGSIKDTDVSRFAVALRNAPVLTRAIADELFAVNEACRVQDPAWPGFLIETISDYIVAHDDPEGYLTAEKARWLLARIAENGPVETKVGLDLLVAAIERARWSPGCLVRLALEAIKTTISTGAGPLRPGQIPLAGTIRAGEVDLIRRILTAFGGEGGIAITRGEAEILFEIDEALAESALNPAWTDLFVKAIGNAMMAAAGYGVPSREEALRAATSMEVADDDLSAAALTASSLSSLRSLYHDQSQEERGLTRLERQRIEIITGEAIKVAEPRWLIVRLAQAATGSAVAGALAAYFEGEMANVMSRLKDQRAGKGKAA
jgi:hypothetical protein